MRFIRFVCAPPGQSAEQQKVRRIKAIARQQTQMAHQVEIFGATLTPEVLRAAAAPSNTLAGSPVGHMLRNLAHWLGVDHIWLGLGHIWTAFHEVGQGVATSADLARFRPSFCPLGKIRPSLANFDQTFPEVGRHLTWTEYGWISTKLGRFRPELEFDQHWT